MSSEDYRLEMKAFVHFACPVQPPRYAPSRPPKTSQRTEKQLVSDLTPSSLSLQRRDRIWLHLGEVHHLQQ